MFDRLEQLIVAFILFITAALFAYAIGLAILMLVIG